ncbi:MAG: hypothetical protein QXS20_03310 [Candidatus Thorarchaeota archaeon]
MSRGSNRRGIKDSVNRLKEEIELSGSAEIARRYFAMNSFDGAMTMLGLLLGGLLSIGSTEPEMTYQAILFAALGTIVAMAMSGFSGSYLTEVAERKKDLNEIEHSMLADLSESMHARAHRSASLFVATVDGISPAITATFILIPMALVPLQLVDIWEAFTMSILFSMLALFALGLFLGKVSGTSVVRSGLKTFGAGLATAVVIVAIHLVTGAMPG